jgi:hypothetical protein
MTTTKLVNGNRVLLTEQEVLAEQNKITEWDSKEGERLSESIRNERDKILSGTDKMALSDRTLSPEWNTYRQELRDITNQTDFPHNITWPTKPTE